MQEHCINIRIPQLYAFGLTDGSHFSHARLRPWYLRFWHWVRRRLYGFLKYSLLSEYTQDLSTPAVGTSYMLLEFIGPETGRMLSETWAEHRHDPRRRARLFCGMAHIVLSLARLPQPRIGSFRLNLGDGTVALTNRPLTSTMMIFENSGAPRTMQPHQVYRNTDTFASDMLTMHDTYFLHYRHAVEDEEDARERMAIRMMLWAVMHHFILPDRRHGPFLPQLTDLHQSNIFVDQDWNVTCLIDLEWICALPVEMLHVPHWLTDGGLDTIIDDCEAFDEARRAFLAAMDVQTTTTPLAHDIPITHIMEESWVSKSVWFWGCITSINCWLFIFEDHIVPKFCAEKCTPFNFKQLSAFWKQDVDKIVQTKVEDEKRYQADLRALFSSQGAPKQSPNSAGANDLPSAARGKEVYPSIHPPIEIASSI